MDEQVDCFHFLATVNDTAMNSHIQIFVWTYVFICVEYISRSRTAALYSKSKLNTVRNYHSVFQGGYNHFTFPHMRVLICPYSDQHLFGFLNYYYRHSSGYEIVSHCGFDLNLSDA